MGRRRRHREPLTTAEQDLVLVHRQVPQIIAKRMRRTLPRYLPAVDLADMIGAGMIGLLKAAQDFDADRGVSFPSYASLRVRGEILDQFRALDNCPRKFRARLGAAAPRTLALQDMARARGEDYPIAEVLPDYRMLQPVEILALADWPSGAISQLPPRQRRVVELYFRDKLLLEEIGERWGVTGSRICEIKRAALATLKEILMPGELTVVQALKRVFRETDGVLTRGEIVGTMGRLSLRPAPKVTRHHDQHVDLWDTLDQRERLSEVQAAADSHPDLFRNHGRAVGWTLRDDKGRTGATGADDAARDDAGDIAPARKEADMPNAPCENCGDTPIGGGKNVTQSKYAARLRLCTRCYGKKPIRNAQRKKLGLSKQHKGPCPQRRRATRPPAAERDPAKLLTGPAATSRKKRPGRTPARRRPTSPPAPPHDPALRAAVGECLRPAFARYAAGELRAIADDLEDSAEEAAT